MFGSRSALPVVPWLIACCVLGLACDDSPPVLDDDGLSMMPISDAAVALDADVPMDATLGADAVSPLRDADADEGGRDGYSANAGELVSHSKWIRADADDDPFPDRPATVACDPYATAPELFGGASSYGVDTALCNYVTLYQGIARGVAAGEVIRVRLAHFELTAPEEAEAHLLVQIDGLALLDEHISIPAASQVLVRELIAPRAISAGARAYFHVHNHGANSYALISLSSLSAHMVGQKSR